jgi:hypothetical protein
VARQDNVALLLARARMVQKSLRVPSEVPGFRLGVTPDAAPRIQKKWLSHERPVAFPRFIVWVRLPTPGSA